MAIAFVQSKSLDGGSATAASLGLTAAVSLASLLVVPVRVGANGRTITVADNKANTYSNLTVLSDGAGADANIFYAANAASGLTTVTLSISGAAATLRFAAHEYSGIATSTPLDQNTRQTYSVAAGGTADSGNVTTTQADELLFGYVEEADGATGFTAGTNYTKREELIVATALKVGTEDRIVAATGTYSASAVLSSNTPSGTIWIATFKGAAAGGTAITAAVGISNWAGQAAAVAISTNVSAGVGASNWQGNTAAVAISTNVAAGVGASNWAGQTAAIAISTDLTATTGVSNWQGQAATVNIAGTLDIPATVGISNWQGAVATIDVPSGAAATPTAKVYRYGTARRIRGG